MIRRIVLSVILSVVTLAIGAGGFLLLWRLKTEPEAIVPERSRLRVEAVRLEPDDVVVRYGGYGTARAERSATIASELAGLVTERPKVVQVGATVAIGDVLLRIDDDEYAAQLQRAESQLEADAAALAQVDVEEANARRLIRTAEDELALAEREYNRIRDLLEQNVSNPRELDAARVSVERARRTLQGIESELALIPARRKRLAAVVAQRKAEVALAGLNVRRCTIRAPFAGRIESVRVEEGEQVSPGRQLLTLLDPTWIEVPIELPVSWRKGVRVGSSVTLTLESDEDVVWQGAVDRIAPSADEQTRTFAVYVMVNGASSNGDGGPPLMAGMFVRAEVAGPTLAGALLVPREAVRRRSVFVCENGVAARRTVTIEHQLQEQTAVAGLTPGTVVLTSNLDALSEGFPVEPVLLGAEVPTVAADDAGRAGTTEAETQAN